MEKWREQRKEPWALVAGGSVDAGDGCSGSGLVYNAIMLPSALGHFSTLLPSRITVILQAAPESEF